MTGATASRQAPEAGLPSPGSQGRRRHRRRMAAGVVVVGVAAAAGAVLTAGVLGQHGQAGSGSSANGGYRTSTATVTRRSLTSQTQVNATVGDAGSWSVWVPQSPLSSSTTSSGGGPASGPGTFTWLPRVGRTLHQGQVIYRVSGSPVVLLYGPVPAYRDLSVGLTGADVTELNTGLVKLGYTTAAALGPRSGWAYYGTETAYAVGLLQAKLGLTETGTLSLGEAVFLPGPALISGWGTGTSLGAPAAPGTVVLTASSTTPVVTIDLDAAQQGEVKVGDPVSITLPSNGVTPGVISQISRVASASSPSGNSPDGNSSSSPNDPPGSGASGATITVLASLTHPRAAGKLNQAPVTVTITTGSVPNVLTVPVNALLAQTGGGYAAEVTGPGGHHLVKVTPGLFDDAAGLVQVTGNLTPGQHVVVPGL